MVPKAPVGAAWDQPSATSTSGSPSPANRKANGSRTRGGTSDPDPTDPYLTCSRTRDSSERAHLELDQFPRAETTRSLKRLRSGR